MDEYEVRTLVDPQTGEVIPAQVRKSALVRRMEAEGLISVAAAARRLEIRAERVHSLIAYGVLTRTVRSGRVWVHEDSVDAYLRRVGTPTAEEAALDHARQLERAGRGHEAAMITNALQRSEDCLSAALGAPPRGPLEVAREWDEPVEDLLSTLGIRR